MRILVATDLSAPADEAIRQASAWAASTGDELVVCQVLPEVRSSVSAHSSHLLQAANRVTAHFHLVTGRSGDSVRVEIQVGDPSDSILSTATRTGAGLIVVGHRGTTGVHRLFLGSVSRSIVTRATCNVLVARPSPRTGRVLAASDFADGKVPEIAAGAAEARRRGGRLSVIHNFDVWSTPLPASSSGFGPAGVPLSSRDVDDAREARTVQMREALRQIDADADLIVVVDVPEVAIVEAGNELRAELVVVGTRGRKGLARVALGSVAEKVVEDAPCSVLVVRPSP